MSFKETMVKTGAKAVKTVSKNSPVILTVVASVGVVGTVALAIVATPKAELAIERAKRQKVGKKPRVMSDEEYFDKVCETKLTPWETVKATWRVYLPTAAVGAVTIASIIGSHEISSGRLETMAAAYTLSEKAREAYKEKVIEEVGPKKEEKIHAAMNEQKVKDNPPYENVIHNDENDIPHTNKDYLRKLAKEHKLCCECYVTGRYFECSMEKLRSVEHLMQEMIANSKGKCVSFSTFMNEVGCTGSEFGDSIGWNPKHPFKLRLEPLYLDDGKEGETVTCIDFDYEPVPNYDDYVYDVEDDGYAPWECH